MHLRRGMCLQNVTGVNEYGCDNRDDEVGAYFQKERQILGVSKWTYWCVTLQVRTRTRAM